MRKTREEKAITLIALIITIVVLLILAVVAINSVTGDGIIQHAVNAKTSYEEAQAKENGILAYYEQYLSTQSGSGPWKQVENKIYMTNEDGKKVEVQIGDKVEYNEGTGKTTDVVPGFGMKDLAWRVLGVNSKGQLELISTDATGSTLTLGGEDGYLNGITKLNKICNDLYSTNIASARSLNVDDINKIAGIDTEEKKAALDQGNGYGTSYKYKYNTTEQRIEYSKSEDEGTWTDYVPSMYNGSVYEVFKEPGKTQIDRNNPGTTEEIKCTYYKYAISTEITETLKDRDGVLISKLIRGIDAATGEITSGVQWLASTCILANTSGVQYRLICLGSDRVTSVDLKSNFHDIEPDGWSYSYRVRPVVTLNSNITLTKGNVDGEWKIEDVNNK